MMDSDYVLYMFNLHPSQKKNKKDISKKMIQNQRSEVQDKGKMEMDQAGSSKETLPEKQKQKGDDFESNIILGENSLSENSNRALRDNNTDNNSKFPIKEGKDVDYHVQQGIPESTMLNSNNIIDLNQSPNKNKEESYKEVIQNERSPKHNGSKNEKEQETFFEEELPEKQQQEDINGEFDLNIITSENSLPNDPDRTLKDTNINGGLKLSMREEKDQDYYRLKQGIPRSIKFRSIIDIYKCSNRLSSPEKEYNWNRLSISQNKKSEVHNKNKTRKDRAGTSKETLPEKQKQKAIQGDFESNVIAGEDSLAGNFNRTVMDNNDDNRSILSMKVKKDQNDHIGQRIPKSTMFESLINLCEAIQNERLEEHNGSKTRKGQHDSIEEELLDQQQQKDINGELEVNRVIGEDRLPNNLDHNVNSGSKLLTRDEKDKKYYIKQGIPRSIKFRSMTNLYKCTNRLSPVEEEYNWNLPIGENPNISIRLTKEDSKYQNQQRECWL